MSISTPSMRVTPNQLVFAFDKLNAKHAVNFSLSNISRGFIPVEFETPKSQEFFLYAAAKKIGMQYGQTFDYEVTFSPSCHIETHERITFRSNQEVLVLPIIARPIYGAVLLPPLVTFNKVNLGTEYQKTFTFEAMYGIPYEFQIDCADLHPAFTISPTSGVIPATGTLSLVLTCKFDTNYIPTDHIITLGKLTLHGESIRKRTTVVECEFNPTLTVDPANGKDSFLTRGWSPSNLSSKSSSSVLFLRKTQGLKNHLRSSSKDHTFSFTRSGKTSNSGMSSLSFSMSLSGSTGNDTSLNDDYLSKDDTTEPEPKKHGHRIKKGSRTRSSGSHSSRTHRSRRSKTNSVSSFLSNLPSTLSSMDTSDITLSVTNSTDLSSYLSTVDFSRTNDSHSLQSSFLSSLPTATSSFDSATNSSFLMSDQKTGSQSNTLNLASSLTHSFDTSLSHTTSALTKDSKTELGSTLPSSTGTSFNVSTDSRSMTTHSSMKPSETPSTTDLTPSTLPSSYLSQQTTQPTSTSLPTWSSVTATSSDHTPSTTLTASAQTPFISATSSERTPSTTMTLSAQTPFVSTTSSDQTPSTTVTASAQTPFISTMSSDRTPSIILSDPTTRSGSTPTSSFDTYPSTSHVTSTPFEPTAVTAGSSIVNTTTDISKKRTPSNQNGSVVGTMMSSESDNTTTSFFTSFSASMNSSLFLPPSEMGSFSDTPEAGFDPNQKRSELLQPPNMIPNALSLFLLSQNNSMMHSDPSSFPSSFSMAGGDSLYNYRSDEPEHNPSMSRVEQQRMAIENTHGTHHSAGKFIHTKKRGGKDRYGSTDIDENFVREDVPMQHLDIDGARVEMDRIRLRVVVEVGKESVTNAKRLLKREGEKSGGLRGVNKSGKAPNRWMLQFVEEKMGLRMVGRLGAIHLTNKGRRGLTEGRLKSRSSESGSGLMMEGHEATSGG
ncbi:hypothetical protein BLNAU_13777 [Blattamonas nauphoetae]|uniref:Uncharacterized protein n=1 Tax=Blattamonas nauphoetae TaxID=2049346 RepID=A0ABQ9XIM1_9EUKA|nr:hypothetical protein BLNAU_13777 [Blattamonas nauphoetae]